MLAEVDHHGSNLVGTTLAWAHNADAALLGVAVGHIQLDEHVVHRLAALLGPGGNLAHQRDGRHRVLVTHEVLGQEAVALLAAAQIAGRCALEVAHHRGNPLEARVAVIHLDALSLSYAGNGLAGDDGLDDVVVVAVQTAQLGIAGDEVIVEDELNLVAVHQVILALVVLEHHADAVGVGVAGQRDVGLDLGGLGYGHLHGAAHLRVGLRHGGEVTAHHVLLGNVDDVIKAPALD